MLNHAAGKVAVALVLLCLPLTPLLAGERPEHYGVVLAYPSRLPADYPLLSSRHLPGETAMPLLVDIDSTGAVTGLTVAAASDSSLLRRYDACLREIVFTPGMREGRTVGQSLPVIVRIIPDVGFARLYFPVDSVGHIEDIDLYAMALRRNGAAMPDIQRFGSYYYAPPAGDTSRLPKYVLVKLALGADGRPASIDHLLGSAHRYTDQILTAINWGEYVPPVVDDQQVSSEAFLAIMLFPDVSYPTCVLEKGDDSLSLTDRLRVRLLPDTVGLLSRPAPLHAPFDGLYPVPRESLLGLTRVGARISIDTLGRSTLVKAAGDGERLCGLLESMVNRLRFSPALDYAGRPVPFEGLLHVGYVDSMMIRIQYSWLVDDIF